MVDPKSSRVSKLQRLIKGLPDYEAVGEEAIFSDNSSNSWVENTQIRGEAGPGVRIK